MENLFISIQKGTYDYFENEVKILSELKKLKQWGETLSPFYVQSAVTKCYPGFKNPILCEIWSVTAFPSFADLTWEIIELPECVCFLAGNFRPTFPESKLLELSKNVSTGFCLLRKKMYLST